MNINLEMHEHFIEVPMNHTNTNQKYMHHICLNITIYSIILLTFSCPPRFANLKVNIDYKDYF
jgi:hypothetical protein